MSRKRRDVCRTVEFSREAQRGEEIKHQHESPSLLTTRQELLAPLPLSVSSDEVATADSTESIEADDEVKWKNCKTSWRGD